jgi:hypothetical protein
MDTLCKSDRRYTWSVDGSSVNVYPRETVGNSSYLLNRELHSIALKNIKGHFHDFGRGERQNGVGDCADSHSSLKRASQKTLGFFTGPTGPTTSIYL